MKPHLLYIRKETQKPAACVLVMCALVLSVFLMGVMLKGLAASAAKHAAQTACISLSLCLPVFFSGFQTQSHSFMDKLMGILYMSEHTRSEVTVIYYFWTAGQVSKLIGTQHTYKLIHVFCFCQCDCIGIVQS